MQLQGFRARGLGPFKDEISVDLAQLGDALLIAVVGGNGEGKSTLLELWGAASLHRTTPTRGSLVDLATGRDSFLEVRVVNGQPWTIRHLVDAVSGKGESVVLDATGAAVLESSKVKAFDAWSAKHLPAPEVLFTTTFQPQGAAGFLGLKPGERKAVLLRVLGIERLELLAEQARERARAAKAALTTAEARLTDERARGGDPEALAGELARAQEAGGVAASWVERERAALATREAEAAAAREQHRVAAERRARRLDLEAKLEAARQRLADLDTRVRNNRAVLADATAIRAAVEQQPTAQQRVTDLTAEDDAARTSLREFDRRYAELGGDLVRGTRRVDETERRAVEARERLAKTKDAVESARTKLDGARARAESIGQAYEAARANVAELRELVLHGKQQRIGALRGTLDEIAEPARPLPWQDLARDALSADDEAAKKETAAPAAIKEAERVAAELQRETVAADRQVADLERVAADGARLAELERDVTERTAESAAARLDCERLDREVTALAGAIAVGGQRCRLAAERLIEARAELDRLQPQLKRAGALDAAEARLAELDPQQRSCRLDVDALTAELAPLADAGTPPPIPALEAERSDVAAAERSSRDAAARVAVLEADLARARVAAERLGSLVTEVEAVREGLADWNQLAEDFGRDGLQALEIDAAGPELTELVNDLLRHCVGSRWTVSIETQRLSADGKRQIEGCDVRVLDTERGREADAETLSGGERVIVGEALSLALSMLACRRAGVKGPTLIRDESGAALDPTNARAYIAMLRRAAELVGASHVLFVSHVPELQELADARLVVANGRVEVC